MTVVLNYAVPTNINEEIKWFHNDTEIIGSEVHPEKYQQMNGQLYILDVQLDDVGVYTCRIGETYEGSASLIVRMRTKIANSIDVYKVRVDDLVTLPCNVIADPHLTVTTTWYRNNEIINFANESRYKQMQPHSLTISNVDASDSGDYVCSAVTELDGTFDVTELSVLIVPKKPLIDEFRCNGSTAEINWQFDDNDDISVDYYTIQGKIWSSSNDWRCWGQYYNELNSTLTNRTIVFQTTIIPWTGVSIRIIAHNKFGDSYPSEPTEYCYADADYPYNHPENVRGNGGGPTNLIISWKPMQPNEHNGPGFCYGISWKRDNSTDNWNVTWIYDWKQNNLTISNQPTYTRYRFKVEAYNDIGRSKAQAVEAIGYSGEGIPKEAPTNLSVTYTNCTSIVLRWNPVPFDSINGRFKAYVIEIWNHIDGTNYTRKLMVDNNSTEITIFDLIPNVITKAHVFVRNSLYQGPPSQTIEIAKEFYRQNFSGGK